MADFEQYLEQIRTATTTQNNNVFNTYSRLWAGLFAERKDDLNLDSLSRFLNPASHQTSGVAGQSKALTQFADFYSTLIDKQFLDVYPMSSVGSPATFDFLGRPASVTYLENLAVLCALREMMTGSLKQSHIVEIGAGYGCMAYFLMRSDAVSSYTIIDLPENLVNSAYFLSQNFPDMPIKVCTNGEPVSQLGINLVLPGHIEAIDGLKFDLAINTDSLGEMRAETAKAYVAWIHEHLREGGYFFSKNGHRRGCADGVQRVSEYGYQRFGLHRLKPSINASSIFDDFSHLALLKKNGPMSATQISQLDTLANLYALGLHTELVELSDRVAEQTTDDEDRRFLAWAEVYFQKGPQQDYTGRFSNCASFMWGVAKAVLRSRRASGFEAHLMSYLQNTRSFAAEVYSNLLLSRQAKPPFKWTDHNGLSTRYFMKEIHQIDSLPPFFRGLAYRVRMDNLRKKAFLGWKPSSITKAKNLAMNIKEKKGLSFQR